MIINYGKHLIDKDDIQSVNKSLSGNNITQGENITKFESALNNFLGPNIRQLYLVAQLFT